MSTLKWVILVAVLGYAGLLGLMYIFQRALMYFPDPRRTAPAFVGLPQADEVVLTSADGERLIAWHVPPQGPRPVVIYFHGNAGALDLRAGRFKWLTADGIGLVALSYRGYGGSTGTPRPTTSPPRGIRRNASCCGASRLARGSPLRWPQSEKSAE
jgi:hypothetical protein